MSTLWVKGEEYEELGVSGALLLREREEYEGDDPREELRVCASMVDRWATLCALADASRSTPESPDSKRVRSAKYCSRSR